ncbi:MATE family efflux transporter [Phenylobacterium sp.]|jgi:MATE family multidrug resistance protein|uniref:MATE family efflux transporter n=1 Tax=Phenylobacterium sp. TaxID=1871053 RepID=UPI002F4184B9
MAASAEPGPQAGVRVLPVRVELAELLKLAGPVVASRLGVMVMGLTDALVVGRYSAEQLGFHALAWAPTSVVVTMAIGLLTGVQVMTARAVGEGRLDRTGVVLRRGLSYGLWIGLAGMVLLLAGGPALLRGLGLEPGLAEGAARALKVFALSLPAIVLSVAAASWLEGLSKPGPAAWLMWIANGVNLGLSLLLVPGTFGLPALGAVGGAWSTLGARSFLAVATLAYIAAMPEARALGVFARPPRDPVAEAEQRRIGFGAGASNFFETAAFASMNVIAGWVGALSVAAWAIVLNVVAIIFMVPLGLAAAAAVRVGAAYGAREPQALRRRALTAFAVALAFGGIISLLVWPASGLIVAGYTRDARTLAMAGPAMALACLFLIPDAAQVVVAQALRARGDVWPPTFTHLASYGLFMAPLAWWLAIPLGMGLTGVVWAVTAASFLSAGLLAARFWALDRRPL